MSDQRSIGSRRLAAITGSASGIGAAVRARLEADGWEVIGVDLAGQEVEADLSTPSGRAAAVADVLALAGPDSTTPTLDAVVACAGLGPQVPDRRSLVSVNYFGAVAVLDGLLPALAATPGSGAVAICSNSISVTPMPDQRLVELMVAGDETAALELAPDLDGPTVYAMTKLALGRALRAPGADRGPTGTCDSTWWPPARWRRRCSRARSTTRCSAPWSGMLPVPMGRPSTAEEIAGPIAFLLSPDAAMIHGSVLFVDGGSDALLRRDHV